MATSFGDYETIEHLGEGSFGELVLARAPNGERVVIKRLKIDMIVDEKALDLFHREAGILRSLHHSCVPRFIDCGVDEEGVPFLVQEHIPGETLDRAVRNGLRFDSVAACELARSLLEALGYLHGLHPPVIHRDLKPANIILSGQKPVIIDFGAVCGKALAAGESTDTVVGTFGYMAPELLKGRASPASDLYSLGATLLFAFSGREPESFPTERLRIRFRDTIALPDHLADLIEQLLEPATEDRTASAAAALAILDRKPSKGGALVKRQKIETPAMTRKRHRVLVGVTAGSAFAVLALMLIYGPAAVLSVAKSAAIGVGIIALVALVVLTMAGGC